MSVIATLACGLLFLASAMTTRAGLHNDVSPVTVAVWLVFGLAATRVARSVWPRPWLPRGRVLLKRLAVVPTVGGWLAGLAIIFGPPNDPHDHDTRRQAWCRTRLEQIATMIASYADDNGGRYPDRPEALLASGLSPDVFVCPSTDDTPSRGDTPPALADAFASGGHLSYVYAGKGLTTATTRPDSVVFYEPARNHTRDHPGIHVLYAGERLEYLQDEGAVRFLMVMRDR